MTINTDNIKYIGGRNKCRDEELDRKIWDNIPAGKISYFENKIVLDMARKRQSFYGGLLRENQHICWHITLQHIIDERTKYGSSWYDEVAA